VIEEYHPDGEKKTASYFVAGTQVGVRHWDEGGRLEEERSLRAGLKHGYQYRFHANGRPLERETYRDGKAHGVGRQWAEDGRLLVTWRMVNGRGLVLWCHDDGTLSGEIYFTGAGGISRRRHWNPDGGTLQDEELWVEGPWTAGIQRQWDARGRLPRGFPHFFLGGRRATRRQYLRACRADPTLPPYRPPDDDPHRQMPAEYLTQREKRIP
jgi:hypothetical protein